MGSKYGVAHKSFEMKLSDGGVADVNCPVPHHIEHCIKYRGVFSSGNNVNTLDLAVVEECIPLNEGKTGLQRL